MTPRAGRRRAALLSISSLALAATLVPAQTSSAGDATPNAVQRWNDVAARAAIASCLSPGNDPLHESRMYALASLAAHDALNAVDRRYATYASRPSGGAGADPDAAVAAASRTALAGRARRPAPRVRRMPCRRPWRSSRTRTPTSWPPCPTGRPRTAASPWAPRLPQAVLATRVDDGVGHADHRRRERLRAGHRARRSGGSPPTGRSPSPPGGARCARSPCAATRPGTSTAPYPLRSRAYARDLATVKRLGGDGITTPSARTPDQTQAARFWIESSPLQWNRIARSVAVDRHLDSWQSARLFSLLDMALADGYVASFAVKYENPFWRPVTAIREADTDGNRRTTADPTWTPLDTTPPIPDHDSAHAVQGGAAAAVLARALGTDRVSFETLQPDPARGPAVRRHLARAAWVRELLAGRAGERRLPGVGRLPLPARLAHRAGARPPDRHARGERPPCGSLSPLRHRGHRPRWRRRAPGGQVSEPGPVPRPCPGRRRRA